MDDDAINTTQQLAGPGEEQERDVQAVVFLLGCSPPRKILSSSYVPLITFFGMRAGTNRWDEVAKGTVEDMSEEQKEVRA